jgi:hypothetical protein
VAVSYRLRLLVDAAEDELDRQGRLLLGVCVEDPRQQAAVDVGLECQPQRRRGFAGVPGPAPGGADRVECGPGVPQEGFADRGERDPARGALE